MDAETAEGEDSETNEPTANEPTADVIADVIADVVAAGAVLWRPFQPGRPEIAVVHRPRYDDWSLPKGKLHRGESAPVAAVRELAEETGWSAHLGHRLGEVRYRVPDGDKVVHYWSARAVAGGFSPNDEVDELRWLTPDAAARMLSYPHDREVLARFRPAAPSPLLLVRHAKAGAPEKWTGPDDVRPLTRKGQAQAQGLVALLRLFGPTRVYSAPPERCVQTVQPLADELGLPVTIEPLLGEDGYWGDQVAGRARLLELARQPGVAAACSQGGVIPEVVGLLVDNLGPSARKASTWVLGFAGDRVVTGDYYPPPAGVGNTGPTS